MTVVVDVNVLAVAEGLHDGATDLCRAACLRIAHQVRDGRTVVVDADDLILSEYVKVLRDADSAGVGKKLASFLYRRRYDPEICHRVALTPVDPPLGSFDEVPEALRDFDLDDHMYIAVASTTDAPVFQALDKEWWDRRQDFVANGIDVQFLCAADLMDAAGDGAAS